MDVNFQSARTIQRGNVVVTTTIDDSLGTKTQEFINIDGVWAYYPQGTMIKGSTPTERSLISQLDLIQAHNFDEPFPEEPTLDELSPNYKSGSPLVTRTVKGKPVLFVTCTKEVDTYPPVMKGLDELAKIKTDYNGSMKMVEYCQHIANTMGLSERYNEYLTEKYRGHIVVFVHDDVHLDDGFVVEKLHEAHEKFNIVGLAGGCNPTFLPDQPPLWHLMTTDHSGFVSHIFPNGSKTNMSVFGDSKKSVDVLDGLFISVDVSSVLDSGVTFDEDFDFHFYDMAFCLRAKEAGLTLGTWPIFVRHEGLGQPDSRWAELAPTFIERYK